MGENSLCIILTPTDHGLIQPYARNFSNIIRSGLVMKPSINAQHQFFENVGDLQSRKSKGDEEVIATTSSVQKKYIA